MATFMTSKPVTSLVSGTGLATAASVQDIMLQQLDALPVMQWLSEALQIQVLTSIEVLRARLRFARERLRDGFQIQHIPALEPMTTLLATDLEAFTPMLERLGDMRAQQLMHAHNDLLRACLKHCHGREVTHTGDGVIAAFHSPRHALRCAVAMQRCMHEHNQRHPNTPLRVRIGLHAGMPLREEDRLFGTCVNVTVRVCSVTSPGQIMTSDAVLDQLEAHDFGLRDRGSFPLKGIAAPVRLHEVCWQRAALPAAMN
jgi:class 3 adenylate cyclase